MKPIYFMLLALLVSSCATGPTYHREFSLGGKTVEQSEKDRLICIRDSKQMVGSANAQWSYILACMAAEGHELVDVLDQPQP